MAARNNRPINVIWVLTDLAHASVNALLAVAGTRHQARLPDAVLSITRNLANTQALVKIANTEAGFRAALTVAAQGAIIRVFTEADHAEAHAMLRGAAWTGPGESL